MHDLAGNAINDNEPGCVGVAVLSLHFQFSYVTPHEKFKVRHPHVCRAFL